MSTCGSMDAVSMIPNRRKTCLLYRHGIQDFTYENEYLSDYAKATNGGSGIEKHEFSHLDCPLDEDNGYFILGKITDDAELHITAFKVPMRHTLYVPGGSIHSNDYLADIDHVHLTKRVCFHFDRLYNYILYVNFYVLHLKYFLFNRTRWVKDCQYIFL